MQRIQYFAQFYHQSGVANGTSSISFQGFHKAVDKLVGPLTAQALDLRSTSAREAGYAIQMLAEAMGDDFEHAALTKNFANLVLMNRKVNKFYEKLLNFNILPQNGLTGFSK